MTQATLRHAVEWRTVGDVLKVILKDGRASICGLPKWERDEDPALFDAIVTLREHIIASRPNDDELFGIGGSYVRFLAGWLTFEDGYARQMQWWLDKPEGVALQIIDARLNEALIQRG